MKKIVAFFSASGSTKNLANNIAEVAGAEIYEIKPATPYTSKDLNWNDKNARSTVEMEDKNSRPELADKNANISDAEVIFLGFPIWWYVAPHIINSFLEAYDFTGKKIVLFATSGGSGFGETVKNLQPSAPNAKFIEGKVFRSGTDKATLTSWVNDLKL